MVPLLVAARCRSVIFRTSVEEMPILYPNSVALPVASCPTAHFSCSKQTPDSFRDYVCSFNLTPKPWPCIDYRGMDGGQSTGVTTSCPSVNCL